MAGVVSGTRLTGLLSTSLAVPGTASQRANSVLAKDFDENIEGTFTVVIRVPSTATSLAALDRRLAAAAGAVPTGRASALQRGDGIVYGDIGSSLGLQSAAAYTAPLRQALRAEGLRGAYVTGVPAFQHDITPVLDANLRLGELLGASTALVLLVLALGASVAVALPFAVALCTTTGTLAIVYGLAHEFLMVLYVPNLVQLIGLGLAVDYSLLISYRFREELAGGSPSVNDAIVATMGTAGRTVAFSGVAVGTGLSALLIIPVPFVRSLGVAGLLVPALSVLAALTLQPALLSLLGRPRGSAALSSPSSPTRRWRVGPGTGAAWARLGRKVTTRPLASAIAAGAVLVMLALPSAWLQLTPASVTAIPQQMGSAKGLDLLRARAGPGVLSPIEVVVSPGKQPGVLAPAVGAATVRLANELVGEPDVFVVAIGSRPPYVDPTRQYRRTVVVERDDFGDEASQALVREMRAQLVPAARFPANVHVYVGGAPAQGVDFLASVYGNFFWVALIVAGIAYVVLLRAFRSLLLPFIALVLDGLSVAASYGLLVLIFRDGIGARLLGLYRASQVEGWVPVFLFAMLFGLSMDYDVFFVARMRESWDKGAANKEAIVEGLSRTGRVVSLAALIMVGALAGMVTGQVAGLQELGAGLALGVLIDATVVRGALMPSIMALLGPRTWWLPSPAARLARVEASPRPTDRGEAGRRT